MCGASAKNTYKAMAKREKILLKGIAGCPISCKERIKMLVKFSSVQWFPTIIMI